MTNYFHTKNWFSLCFIVWMFFFTRSFPVNAQKYVIDSLIASLEIPKEDTSQINLLNEISQNCSNTGDYKRGMQFALEAKQKAIQAGFQNGIAKAYNNIGIAFWYEGRYESAMNNYFLSLKIHKSINNLIGIAAVYNNLGNLYLNQSDYKASMVYHLKALDIRKQIKDKKGLAGSYNNVGNVYRSQGDYEKAVKNYLSSLELKEELSVEFPDDTGLKKGIGNTYNNIGLIYLAQSNYEKALESYTKSLEIRLSINDNQGIGMSYSNIGAVYYSKGMYEKTLEYQLKALKKTQEIGDTYGAGMIYDNIGSTYFHLNDFEKALTNHLKALKIKKEIGDKRGVASANINIGRIYIAQNQLESALAHLNEGTDILKDIGGKEGLKSAYSNLSTLYVKKGAYKEAYKYHQLFSQMNDSLLNEQSNKQISEMNIRYDSEKKDKELIKKDAEIIKHQAEADKKALQRNAFISGFVLILILAFFIFRSYSLKKNSNQQLEGKNELIEKQKKLVEEKNQKITDSIMYAKRIQQATLPSEEAIEAAFPDSFILFLPKDIVSGDFYWHSRLSPDMQLLVVADCTGHGVPGAFMSMIGNTLLNEIVNIKRIHSPSEILNELNKGIVSLLNQSSDASDTQDDGMDVTIVAVNNSTGEIEYAAANHYSYIVSNRNIQQLKGDVYSIGGMFGSTDVKFTSQKLQPEKGSILYLFTDGYIDQFGGDKNTKFTSARLENLLNEVGSYPMDEQKEKLLSAFNSWKSGNKQLDDILVIGIRV